MLVCVYSQTLFKPSLLSTKEGGTVVATNHVSTVDCAEWMESLSRCVEMDRRVGGWEDGWMDGYAKTYRRRCFERS